MFSWITSKRVWNNTEYPLFSFLNLRPSVYFYSFQSFTLIRRSEWICYILRQDKLKTLNVQKYKLFAWPQHFWLFLFNPCSMRVSFLDSCFVATRNLYFYYYSYYYDTKCMCFLGYYIFIIFFLIFPQILALSINWINMSPLTNKSIPPNINIWNWKWLNIGEVS